MAELVEQYVAQLLGTADREFLPGKVVDLALQPVGFLLEFARQLRQPLAIDLDAMTFHRGDDGDQRPVDPFVNLRCAFARQAPRKHLMQPPGNIRILGGIFGRAVERDLAERNRLLAGAADILESQRGVAEMALRQLVHPVPAADPVEAAPRIHRETFDHGVVNRVERDPVPGQDIDVVFDVLADFQHAFRLQQRFQRCQRGFAGHLLGPFRQ